MDFSPGQPTRDTGLDVILVRDDRFATLTPSSI